MAKENKQSIRPSKVREIIYSSNYNKGMEKLLKQGKAEEYEKVIDIVDDLANFRITKEYHNHPLHGKLEGYWDLHVRKNIILIYRYTGKGLEIDLELNDLTDHDYGFSNTRK